MNKKQFIIETVKNNFYEYQETWVYGGMQNYFVNFRATYTYPKIFSFAVNNLAKYLKKKKYDYICGVETAGLPLAGAIAFKDKIPSLYIRTKRKETGPHRPIEGHYRKGQTIYVVDDIVVRPEVTINFFKIAEDVGLKVLGVVSMYEKERFDKGRDIIISKGYDFYSIFSYKELEFALENYKELLHYKKYLPIVKKYNE